MRNTSKSSKKHQNPTVGGKMAKHWGKRKGGDPEFIGVFAFSSIIGGIDYAMYKDLKKSDISNLVKESFICIYHLKSFNK